MHLMHLLIIQFFIWLSSKRPNLIEYNTETPDITSCGIFAVFQGLRGCPPHRYKSTPSYVVIFIL